MKSAKHLGIWMDHSVAYLLDLTNDTIVTSTIESKPKLQVNEADLYYKDESHALNKEQSKLSVYYKKLSDVMRHFDVVLLFGPTDAKLELVNSLQADRHFDKIKIEVKTVDKMNENERNTFVKEYFNALGKASKNLSNSSFFFF